MDKSDQNQNERHFLPSFSELVDRLTVDQIKEVILSDRSEEMSKEIQTICKDIDIMIEQKQISRLNQNLCSCLEWLN